MNLGEYYISGKALIFLSCLAISGVLSWFASDMRSLLRSAQRRNQLAIEGRWTELEQAWERASATRRPFAWFHQHFLLSGSNAVQHGLFLFEQGRLEDALIKEDQAITQIGKKPLFFRPIFRAANKKTLCGAHAARVLILTAMGRYGEAREAVSRLRQASGSDLDSNASLALLEVNCGRLDEALALATTVPPGHHQFDVMRGIIAWVYSLKGEFLQAIETMKYEPSGILKYYRPEDLDIMKQSSEGTKLIELQGRKLAGIFPPARWLRLAGVHLEQEAFANADEALSEVEKSLGSNRVLQISYWRGRIRSYAGQGKASEAEKCIAQVRALTQQFRRRSTVLETDLAIGRAYFSLRRFDAALLELAEAQRNVLHPIERHQVAYWIARTHEAAGHPGKALPYFHQVASDPIPSWMRRHAEAVSQKLESTISPPLASNHLPAIDPKNDTP